jgi:hypothetical protein
MATVCRAARRASCSEEPSDEETKPVNTLPEQDNLEFLESLEMVEDADQVGIFELTAEGRAYLVQERLVR